MSTSTSKKNSIFASILRKAGVTDAGEEKQLLVSKFAKMYDEVFAPVSFYKFKVILYVRQRGVVILVSSREIGSDSGSEWKYTKTTAPSAD